MLCHGREFCSKGMLDLRGGTQPGKHRTAELGLEQGHGAQ